MPATPVTNAIGSTTAPTVTGIALTSTPTYAAYGRGGDVEATVTFDAAVDITGTPQPELERQGWQSTRRRGQATGQISMCRKRPFGTGGRGRLAASAAVCRIPCLILCLAYIK